MDIFCKHIWIIEWYDGIIQGVVEDFISYWFISLQAFDATHSRKLYIAARIDTDLARQMDIRNDTPVQVSDTIFETLLVGDNVFVTTDEPANGARLNLRPLKDSERQYLKAGGFQIENAVSEKAVKFWLTEQG